MADTAPRVHWLLPIDPAAHADHLPPDWRTSPDATDVWRAIGFSQPIERWCLRSGYRTMRPGDLVWAYLSRRQELCAVGTVRRVEVEAPGAVTETDCPSVVTTCHRDRGRPAAAEGGPTARFVVVDWDAARTAALCRAPLPRAEFDQIPMSTCRARAAVVGLLERRYATLGPETRPAVTAEQIERSVLDLLARRREGATICPSEVARALAPEDGWRDLMVPVRDVAARLVDEGRVEITQRGEVVDVRTVAGPVRIRLARPPSPPAGGGAS